MKKFKESLNSEDNVMKIYNTGFSPSMNSYLGTSDEHFFYETTSVENCLSSITKNEQFMLEKPCYLVSEIIVA